ncbi:MAG TPA: methylmalonyl-CoA mutase family protein, partial [Candidatus Binatus sp.]|nr:methylmalonyl-CoA mutase family protein [Candidatus Binatus sp.]
AVFGGAQSLHTNSRDEALSLPTEESVRIALRTQQIIAHESGATKTADPLAGSYYLEALTETIEEEASALLNNVERLGGAKKAIESGFVQRQIQESAYDFQKRVDEGRTVIVGVNKFTEGGEKIPKIHRLDPKVEEEQIERLRHFRQRRDNMKVKTMIGRIEESARKGKENIIPYILSAVRAECTVGEISDSLRNVYGEYRVKLSI